jgi:hypothetical protein
MAINRKMQLYLLLFLISTFSFVSCSDKEQCETNIRNRSTNEQFSGVIKEVYFQVSNGGRFTPTIVLTDNEKYYSATKRLICYAMPGDSIIKKRGTLQYVIKRPDTMVVFYPNCGDIVILDNGKTAVQPYQFNDCGKVK